MGTIFAKLLQEHKWICHITSGEATSDMTYSRVLLQKLCKNCPHPEKPFSNSKTISQIKFPYRIEKLVKSQQEWPGGKTLCRSLVTCKGFFCPVVLLLLLCENEDCRVKLSIYEISIANHHILISLDISYEHQHYTFSLTRSKRRS